MRMRSLLPLYRATSLCLVCSAALAACSSGKTAVPANPPPEVSVVTLDEGVNEQGLLLSQRAVTHNSLGEATTMNPRIQPASRGLPTPCHH
jgi:hypothetical protein